MTTNGYLFKEGIDNLKKHGSKTFSTMLIISATMLVLGTFLIILQNVITNVNAIKNEQGLQAFISDGKTNDEISYMRDQIKNIEGTKEVVYISKDKAFEDAKKVFEGQEYLLEGLEKTKPFSASFVITFKNLDDATRIKDIVSKIDGIYKVKYNETIIHTVLSFSKGISIFLIALGSVMLIISIFIISNTIKLALYSNKREIYIMKYIGATNSFIRKPFIIEGATIGTLSALISFVVISVVYVIMYARVTKIGTSVGTFGLLPYSGIWYQVVLLFLFIGLFVGILGSYISTSKYLKD